MKDATSRDTTTKRPSNNHRHEWLHSAFHAIWMALNLLAISALLLADISVLISPADHSIPAIMGIGFGVLVVLNVLLMLSWLFTHRKAYALVGLTMLVLSMPNILRNWSHGSGKAPADATRELRLMTYNTHCMQSSKRAAHNPIIKYIRESGADIVFLQEYEVRKNSNYLTFDNAKLSLADIYPYTYYDFTTFNKRRQYGLAIYSKYPLINKQSLHYETRHNLSCRCDVVVNTDTFRLFHNHLESNLLTPADMHIDETGDFTESMKTSFFRVLAKMVKAYAYRAEEARVVREAMDESPYPVIVAGDFNDVPTSYTYRTLSRGLNDAFLCTSYGQTGHTFYKGVMGVRIDYLLTDKQLHAVSCMTDTVTLSDHQPVHATLCY